MKIEDEIEKEYDITTDDEGWYHFRKKKKGYSKWTYSNTKNI